MEKWISYYDDDNDMQEEEGTIPIAALVYSRPDLEIPTLTPGEHVASQKDEDAQMKTF